MSPVRVAVFRRKVVFGGDASTVSRSTLSSVRVAVLRCKVLLGGDASTLSRSKLSPVRVAVFRGKGVLGGDASEVSRSRSSPIRVAGISSAKCMVKDAAGSHSSSRMRPEANRKTALLQRSSWDSCDSSILEGSSSLQEVHC
jgi:hypothetical protein